jgi:DNA-binding transcriptional LysR family regulator
MDPELLRSFVAVGEELHFSRAAARRYLSQQAISRHIRRLERDLGVQLFARTTREVALTAAGQRLLPLARHLLDIHDRAVAAVRGRDRPLLVDTVGDGLTPTALIDHARQLAPDVEFLARYGGGVGASLPQLAARYIDVSFGRSEGGPQRFDPRTMTRRLVRLEPLGLLLLDDDPLAEHAEIPLDALAGREIDVSAGNPAAPEWTDLGTRLLAPVGAAPSPPHATAAGGRETRLHLRAHGRPILAMTHDWGSTTIDASAGVVRRPLRHPTPLYPWALLHLSDLRHPGLDALHHAIDAAAADHGWLDPPDDAWIPEADARAYGLASPTAH